MCVDCLAGAAVGVGIAGDRMVLAIVFEGRVHRHFFTVGADHLLIERRAVGTFHVYTRVPLLGAASLNFDFATLSFQLPSMASAADAAVPKNSVLSSAIVMIFTIARLP